MKHCACGQPAVVELLVTSAWSYRAAADAPERVKEIVARLSAKKLCSSQTTTYCESCLRTVGEVAFPT